MDSYYEEKMTMYIVHTGETPSPHGIKATPAVNANVGTPLTNHFVAINNVVANSINTADSDSISHNKITPAANANQHVKTAASNSPQPGETDARSLQSMGNLFTGYYAPTQAHAENRSTSSDRLTACEPQRLDCAAQGHDLNKHVPDNSIYATNGKSQNDADIDDGFCLLNVSRSNNADTGIQSRNIAVNSQNDADTDDGFCSLDNASVNHDAPYPVNILYNNPVLAQGALPPTYQDAPGKNAVFNISLKTYIRDTLLPEVNRHGRPPVWLRPLAGIASWFGFHGVGQTNCMSCATAVADTLKTGVLHTALPDLRGGRPDKFATFDNVSRSLFGSVGQLADKLRKSADINAVVTVERPRWRRLFSPVAGHACNIIKAGDSIHLVDTQKKSHVTVDRRLGQPAIHKALLRFLGPVATTRGAISLGNIGFLPPPLTKIDA